MYSLLKMWIFHCHVSLPEGRYTIDSPKIFWSQRIWGATPKFGCLTCQSNFVAPKKIAEVFVHVFFPKMLVARDVMWTAPLNSKQVETAARCKISYMMLLRFKLPNLPLLLSYPMDWSFLGAFPIRMIMIKWAKRLQNLRACDVSWFRRVCFCSAVGRKPRRNRFLAGGDVFSFLRPKRSPTCLEPIPSKSIQLSWCQMMSTCISQKTHHAPWCLWYWVLALSRSG